MNSLGYFICYCFSAFLVSASLCAAIERPFKQTDPDFLRLNILNVGYSSKPNSGLDLGDENDFNMLWTKSMMPPVAGTKVTVKSNYMLSISCVPTGANREARLLPHVTRLRVQCADGTQLLKNFNYFDRKIFEWSPESCGDVILEIGVGKITINKKYKGKRGFPKFLWDFGKGERVFTPEEFPAQEHFLRLMRIQYIKVRYEFNGDALIRSDFTKSSLSAVNRTETTHKSHYRVSIKGLPTDANPKARIQPHATRLEVKCAEQLQTLINRNYPIRKMFNWSSENCGDVILQIEVGNLILRRKYTGDFAFAKFLQDFASGGRKFYVDDFPEQENFLRKMGIEYIKVKYKFTGDAQILNNFY